MEQYQQVDTQYNCTHKKYLFVANFRLAVHDQIVEEQVKRYYQQKQDASIRTVLVVGSVAHCKSGH